MPADIVEYDLKEVLGRIEDKIDAALAEFRAEVRGLGDRVGRVESRMDAWDYVGQANLRDFADVRRAVDELSRQKVGADAVEEHNVRLTQTRRWLFGAVAAVLALSLTVIGMIVTRF